MVIALTLLVSANAQTVDAYRLEYSNGIFGVKTHVGDWKVAIAENAKPPPNGVAFRRNDDYAVWDARGLTIRVGDGSRAYRFDDFPKSPRFFSTAEIQDNQSQFDAGTRKRSADSLSGAVRVGPHVYFLVRWTDSNGTAWTEALVQVELGSKTAPVILGRFEGLSIAHRKVDNCLFLWGEELGCVVRQDDRWGVASYDLKSGQFGFKPYGASLQTFMSPNPSFGVFVEKTPYGAVNAGRVDLRTAFRRNLAEARGTVRFLDVQAPLIVLVSEAGFLRVLNADTGAELRLGEDYGVGRAGPYVVTWKPLTAPRSATLYDPIRWRPVARWRAP